MKPSKTILIAAIPVTLLGLLSTLGADLPRSLEEPQFFDVTVELPLAKDARILEVSLGNTYEVRVLGTFCDARTQVGDDRGLVKVIRHQVDGEDCLIRIELGPTLSSGEAPTRERGSDALALTFRGRIPEETQQELEEAEANILPKKRDQGLRRAGEVDSAQGRPSEDRVRAGFIEDVTSYRRGKTSVVLFKADGRLPVSIKPLSATPGYQLEFVGVAAKARRMSVGHPPVELIELTQSERNGVSITTARIETSERVEPELRLTEGTLMVAFPIEVSGPATRTAAPAKPSSRTGATRPASKPRRRAPTPPPRAETHTGHERFVRYGDDVVIKAAILRSTIIVLNPDEQVRGASLADSERWDVDWGAYGPDHSLTPTVAITPHECGITTNLQLMTTKRLYPIILDSPECRSQRNSSNPSLPFDAVVRYRYPNQRLVEEVPALSVAATHQPDTAFGEGDLDGLLESAAKYRVVNRRGYKGPKPTLVMDDGTRTFLVFADDAWRGRDLPLFFLESENARRELANYDVKGSTFVVNSLFQRAVLVGGTDEKRPRKQPRLEIVRSDTK